MRLFMRLILCAHMHRSLPFHAHISRDMYAPGAFEGIGIPDTEPVKWAHSVISAKVAYYIS